MGTQITKKVFSRFGLTMHARTGDKSSKTKVFFFPSTRTIKRWRHNKNFNRITSQESNNKDVEFKEDSKVDLSETCKKAPETKPLILNEETK